MENQKGSNINLNEYLDLFKGAMKKLAMAVDKEMGEARLLIYFEHLHTYKIKEIQAAVDDLIHDEEFNVIPTVGKLIRYIEDARREKWNIYNPFQIESKREEISSERLRELLKPFRDKLVAAEEREREERELRWQKNKEKLEGQVNLMKVNADPAKLK